MSGTWEEFVQGWISLEINEVGEDWHGVNYSLNVSLGRLVFTWWLVKERFGNA